MVARIVAGKVEEEKKRMILKLIVGSGAKKKCEEKSSIFRGTKMLRQHLILAEVLCEYVLGWYDFRLLAFRCIG